jgi:hypothetical protein
MFFDAKLKKLACAVLVPVARLLNHVGENFVGH